MGAAVDAGVAVIDGVDIDINAVDKTIEIEVEKTPVSQHSINNSEFLYGL